MTGALTRGFPQAGQPRRADGGRTRRNDFQGGELSAWVEVQVEDNLTLACVTDRRPLLARPPQQH